MSDTMRLTLQLTAIDMLSGVLSSARQHIQSLGQSAKKVQQDFEVMTNHITTGLRALAVGNYGFEKIKKGVDYAASLEEAMGNVQMDLMRTGQSAADLNAQLAQVRSTAVSIQAFTPFSAEDVVKVEDTLLKAGLKMKDVVGKGGAAWAASALATVTGNDPTLMAQNLVHAAIPFKIAGSDYGKLADDLQRASVASGAPVEIIGGQLKEVAGQAASMHISLKEMVTTLGVLFKHGMGEESGHSLSMFLTMLNGITPKSIQYMRQLGINAYDTHGHIKPMIDIINQLRFAFSKLTDQQRQQAAVEIFSRRGMRVALDVLEPGEGSYEDIAARMTEQASLQKKIEKKSEEYITNMHALQTTWQSTQATFFTPFLHPLTEALKLLNDVASKLGEIGEEHKALASIFSSAMGTGIAAAGGYGLYELFKGGLAGSRVLRGMGGIKGILKGVVGTGAGIAEGKVIQAATGVTPVFVTNWPGTPIVSQTKDIAVETAAAGEIKSLGTKAAAALGAESIASLGLLTGATVGAGVLLGKGINWLISDGGPLATATNKINEMLHLNPNFEGNRDKWEKGEAAREKLNRPQSLWSLLSGFANRNVTTVKPVVTHTVFQQTKLTSNTVRADNILTSNLQHKSEMANNSLHPGAKEQSVWDAILSFINRNANIQQQKPEVKNNVAMNIYIDEDNRVSVETRDMNTHAVINTMKRGKV